MVLDDLTFHHSTFLQQNKKQRAERETSHLMVLPLLRDVTLWNWLERGRTDEHVNQSNGNASRNSTEHNVEVKPILHHVPLEATGFDDHLPIFRHASYLS